MTRSVLLVPGPESGNGRHDVALGIVERRLRQAGFEITTAFGGDAAASGDLIREAVEKGTEIVVVAGGDGMVNLAAQVLAGTDVALGIIPLGTGNDTARALGIPLRDPAAAADRIVAGRMRRIDLARAGERYFATVLAAGFDAAVNEEANTMRWPRGNAKYTLAIVRVLSRFKPIRYTLDLDGVERSFEGMLVSVGNSDSMGGGVRVTHGADLSDGLLDVVLFHTVGVGELIKTYPKLFKGTHVTHPAYERHQVRRVTVAAPGVVAYADGERFGALPLTVEVVPGALSVLC
jgi:diacylglycerol kinase (ATP)